jgi:hypothetical protein
LLAWSIAVTGHAWLDSTATATLLIDAPLTNAVLDKSCPCEKAEPGAWCTWLSQGGAQTLEHGLVACKTSL